jgi:hypothetical protein
VARVRPLSPNQARKTLANRLGRVADDVRQIATNIGVRPYRVFLIWTKWVGTGTVERGEGTEYIIQKLEILPTPRVTSLDGLSLSIAHAGVIPIGSVRVDRISVRRFTEDVLKGKAFPCDPLPFGERIEEKHIPEPYDFFWEIVEDGRGDCPAKRRRFRPMTEPVRRPGKPDWTLMLDRVSLDRNRLGESTITTGEEG